MSNRTTSGGARTSGGGRIELDRRLRWVPIVKMRVSERAQRLRKQEWVDHLAANFNFDVMNVPTLNLRTDGSYYICDGQHCIWALDAMGYGDQQVQCWVYEGLTEEDEAELFLELNNNLTVTSYDKFTKSVVSGRELETNIDRLVRANKLFVSREKVPGAVSAVGTLTRVYERMDDTGFARVLRIIRDSFGDGGFSSAVIDGIGHLVARYDGVLDEQKAVARLSTTRGGAHGLLQKAEILRRQTGAAKGVCVAAAAVEIINGGGGKKLASWWK